jgi:transcriptional repressor NrdR
MKCPDCGSFDNKVLETRLQKDGEIRRRRECLHCHVRFSTVESIVISCPNVVKKDGRREDFSRDKLRRGIQIACKKRPVSMAEVEQIVGRISKWVRNQSDKEVEAQAIGQAVIDELKNLDGVAYVRFASVYRTFRDINEFVESLDPVRREK